jgi:type IV pilus assembly protein PilP
MFNTCYSAKELDLNAKIKIIKSMPLRPIADLPEFKSPEKFRYPENDSRRNPFVPKALSFIPNNKRVKEPLESYPLDDLKFVGVIKEGQRTWALIQEPNGFIFRVHIGNYIGQNFGKIIDIKEKMIKLEETVKISNKWKKRVSYISALF